MFHGVSNILVLLVAVIALGLATAAILSQLMTSLLFGISTRDPLTFALGRGTLVVVALSASCIPALRATGVDPVAALRAE